MLIGFRHKGLAELWTQGRSAKVDVRLQRRILVRLEAMHSAVEPADLNVGGFDFHSLRGFDPTRYSIHVNGPWCLTFVFDGPDVTEIDFEQYH